MKTKIIICLSMLFLLALPISLAETFQDDEAGLENYDTLPLEYFYNPETAIIDYPLAKPVVQGIPMSLSSFANLDVKLKKAANFQYNAQILGVEDMGNNIGRFHVSIASNGLETRDTWVLADLNSPAVLVYDELMQADSQVRTLYDEAVRSRGYTRRWLQPPVIYVSKSTELTKGAKVTDPMLNEVLDVLKQDLPSQFGYYAEQADIRVVDEVPFIKNDPNQPGKWPAHPPEDSIVIQFNNMIPGLGSAGLSDYDKNGYIDNGVVFLRTTPIELKTTARQEIGTVFLFENFPKTMPPKSSVYLESQTAETFTPLDTAAAYWGYSRPGYNMKDDKDDGWGLSSKEINGNLAPCEERLLLDGPVCALILIPGDFDEDNDVDFKDFLALAKNFNKQGEFLPGDINYDNKVNFADFLLFARNSGRTRWLGASKPTSSPEEIPSEQSMEASIKALQESGNGQELNTFANQGSAYEEGSGSEATTQLQITQPGAINQLKVISQPETINNQLEVITSPANILIQQPTTTTLEETTTTTTTPPEQVTYKASDFNENGCVDEQDYITFQSYFSAKDSNADLDSDGEVAFADFLFFARENKEYGC